MATTRGPPSIDANESALVENPPVARALHASVEIDQEIPPEHYKAVAEAVDIRHFVEAGLADEDAKVDIAFIEEMPCDVGRTLGKRCVPHRCLVFVEDRCAGREGLLRVFELLGDDPRVNQYRRRMTSLLY